MKKLLIGIVSLGVLALLAMPFINGIIAEKAIRKVVANANQLYQDTKSGMKIEILSYERGITSSEIEWRLDFGQYKAFYKADGVIFNEQAKHGYTGVTSETSLEKNTWYTEALEKYGVGEDPLHINTHYSLSGDIKSNILLEPFAVTIGNDTIDVYPADFTIACDAAFKTFSSEGSWEGLQSSDRAKIGKTAFDSELTMITSLIWEGSVQFNFDGMKIQEGETGMEMAGLKGDYLIDFNEKANSLDIDVTYGIDNITVPEKNIDDMSVTLAVKGLDATAYEEAMEIYMDFISTLMENIGEAGDDPKAIEEALSSEMMGIGLQMMAVYEKLLKSGLEISVKDVKATFPEGKVEGNATIALLQDMTIGSMMPMAAQPNLIFDYINLNTKLRIPKALTGDNPMLTAPAYPGMQTGLFIEDGDYLKHEAETRDKKLFINGQELEL